MQIPANAETKNITVQGVKMEVPQPFAEGHPLTDAEAQALNQVLAENLRNNFATRIRNAKDEAEKAGKEYNPDTSALQAEMNEYVGEYEFGAKRTGGTSTAHLDPVEKEMQNMAKQAIKTAIQAKGLRIKDVPKDKMDAFVDQYMQKNYEALHKNASVIVEAREGAAATADSLDI